MTCCEGATSCIAFPDGHNQCCQRDWLCGTGPGAICCPPPDVSGGGLCTRTEFGYECLPAF
ncbi:MAG: hypothetical protein NVSMB47_07500 [Polyangiales bacterium]